MTIQEIINEIDKLPKKEKCCLIYLLFIEKKISFHEIAKLSVDALMEKEKENRRYALKGAVALEAFRPGGMFKGKFKVNEKCFAGGLDGFKAKALLFLKHYGFFRNDIIAEELNKIDKNIVETENKF